MWHFPKTNLPITYSPSNSQPTLNPNKPYRYTKPSIDLIQKIGEATDPKTIPSKMLLTLLKSGISNNVPDEKIFIGRSYADWVNMYNMAHQNAVMPVVYDGLSKNPSIKIPKDVKANMEINKKFAQNYHSQQEWILKNFTEMTSSNNVDTVQMKGIGFSMNYPNPTSRFGGDIDIYNYKHGTNPSNPDNNMSHFVDSIAKKHSMKVDTNHGIKHSEIKLQGMPIENHRNFLNVECSPLAKKMNTYLYKVIKPIEETLPHGTKILVPSKEFNTVFLSFHAMQHFIFGGINFHHLADWAVHINKNGLQIPAEAKGTKFEEFMYAFTNLANKHLGTNIKVPENKKLEYTIYNRMLHPEKPLHGIEEPKTKNPLKIIWYKYQKIAKTEIMKKEYLGDGSVSKALYNSLRRHIKNPKSIINAILKVRP